LNASIIPFALYLRKLIVISVSREPPVFSMFHSTKRVLNVYVAFTIVGFDGICSGGTTVSLSPLSISNSEGPLEALYPTAFFNLIVTYDLYG
jgi:hypothetical protein